MLSQEEATLLSISCESGCLRATCKLPLEAAPVACEPLGHGFYFIIDASANTAILTITETQAAAGAPAPRSHCTVTMHCCSAPYGPEAPLATRSSLEGAAAADCDAVLRDEAPAREARHVSAACALPCSHLPELKQFAALVVVGTMAGPACVIGVPRDGLKHALQHPASAGPACSMCAPAITCAVCCELHDPPSSG